MAVNVFRLLAVAKLTADELRGHASVLSILRAPDTAETVARLRALADDLEAAAARGQAA